MILGKEGLMLNVSHGKEIILRVKNDMGVLEEITRLIAERGISVVAVLAMGDEDMCRLHLVTTDNLRACDLLEEHAYAPVEEPVVLVDVPHKAGMLKGLTKRLDTEGIHIRQVYATSRDQDANCLMVLRTTNDTRAMVALSEFVKEIA
jgi:hypothetical protein